MSTFALVTVLYYTVCWDTQSEDTNLWYLDTIGNCQRLAFTVGVSQHNLCIK